MSTDIRTGTESSATRTALWRHPVAVAVYLLVVVWGVMPFLPEDWRFGLYYRVFFSVVILIGLLLVLFANTASSPAPQSRTVAVLSMVGVYLLVLTVPLLSGIVYPLPQLPRPKPEDFAAELTPVQFGRQLFFGEGLRPLQPQCALCHMREGKGGQRGPEMDDLAERAGGRIPGVSAEDYVRNHILKGSAYFTVPDFPPIMPPFESIIKEEQMEALLAYLFAK